MSFLRRPNELIARVATVLGAVCIAILCALVLYGVVMRYVFNDAPDFVEPIALLLIVAIAFFGAALRVRDRGHIGLDSFVARMSPRGQRIAEAFQLLCLIAFSAAVFVGSYQMADTTWDDQIPILNLPEAIRYYIPMVAAVCTILFSLEHLLDMFARERT
jgi:TRAP-type transport system small permease protein